MAGEYRRGNLLTLIWDWDKYHDLAMPVYINDYPIDIFRRDLEQLFLF